MNRQHLEAIAAQSLSVYDTAIKEGLPALLKSDNAYGELRQALVGLSTTLVRNRLSEKAGDGWTVAPDRIAGLAPETLDQIAAQGADVVRFTSADAVVFKLDEAGKTDFLRAVAAAEPAFVEAGIETPNSQVLRDALRLEAQHSELQAEADAALASAQAATVFETKIPDARLYDVASASLGLLEEMHKAGIEFSENDAAAAPLKAAFGDLAGSLGDAAYMLPGASSARKASYAEQSPRGTHEQGEAILDAAARVSALLGDGAALDAYAAEGGQFGQLGLRTAAGRLNGAVANAVPEEIARQLDEAEIAAAEIAASNPLSTESAGALLDLMEAAEKMADKAQLDTAEPDRVMVSNASLKKVTDALAAMDKTDAEIVLRDAADAMVQLPGISTGSAGQFVDAIENLRDMTDPEMLEKRGAFKSIQADYMDKFNQLSGNLMDVGALTSLGALAGRGEITAVQLTEGRDSAQFATLREAMSASRPPSPMSQVRGYGKVLPEMSMPKYLNLPEEKRKDGYVFIMRPGVGHFAGYEGGRPNDTQTLNWQANRLRSFIRGKLVDEEGKPEMEFRSFMMGLRTKSIIAPTEHEAVVIRQESERLYLLHKKQHMEKVAQRLESSDFKAADFAAKDVRTFLTILEASGSSEAAALTKRGDAIVLEHPEAPTITATTDRLGTLEKQRDGYQLHKVDPMELRAAFETGQPAVRLVIADDRPIAIKGVDPKTAAVRAKPKEEKIIDSLS